jgi:hypothetical protein
MIRNLLDKFYRQFLKVIKYKNGIKRKGRNALKIFLQNYLNS